MAYTKTIDRKNPSCILFLIDRSGSMADPISGAFGKRKANAVADAVNRLLSDLIIKCTKGEGIRYYYDVGVIGYGSDPKGVARVGPAFVGTLTGQYLVPISEAESNPARLEERRKKEDDGMGGLVESVRKFPIWFDPVAEGNTPMCAALRMANQTLQDWLAQHPESYPPIVINITDGESSDGDPSNDAQDLTSLATSDGNVLLFNCHISSREAAPLIFPESEAGLPDEYACMLFRMSSMLPDGIRSMAAAEGYTLRPGARGFAFNADLVELIRFLDIGTRGADLR